MQNDKEYSASFGNINYGAIKGSIQRARVTFYYCAMRYYVFKFVNKPHGYLQQKIQPFMTHA